MAVAGNEIQTFVTLSSCSLWNMCTGVRSGRPRFDFR